MTEQVKEEFGRLVSEELDNRKLSLRNAWYKTGVHYNTVQTMRKGLVPRKEIIERFAAGLGIDVEPFLIAAGLREPKDTLEALGIWLRSRPDVTEEEQQEVIESYKRVRERRRQRRQGG
jgi:hypothetical protein